MKIQTNLSFKTKFYSIGFWFVCLKAYWFDIPFAEDLFIQNKDYLIGKQTEMLEWYFFLFVCFYDVEKAFCTLEQNILNNLIF